MVRFFIKDFSISENSYKVVGMLPGGFHGTVTIGMTEDLKSVLAKLNALSGAVQANFLPMWLNGSPVELPKQNDSTQEKEESVPLIAGAEDSTPTQEPESKI